MTTEMELVRVTEKEPKQENVKITERPRSFTCASDGAVSFS